MYSVLTELFNDGNIQLNNNNNLRKDCIENYLRLLLEAYLLWQLRLYFTLSLTSFFQAVLIVYIYIFYYSNQNAIWPFLAAQVQAILQVACQWGIGASDSGLLF